MMMDDYKNSDNFQSVEGFKMNSLHQCGQSLGFYVDVGAEGEMRLTHVVR